MSLPSSHILPPSTFRHIGIMVIFMSCMASFCAFGFIAVQTITATWTKDIQDTISIEIPSFDQETETVFEQKNTTQKLLKIQKYLNNDPIILSLDIKQFDGIASSDSRFDIPAPIFMTLHLHEKRATNAETRIINNIKRLVPHVIIKESESWEKDIKHTANTLRLAFGGLALSVFLVTAIMLSATIQNQLKANKQTVQLIHMIGAQSSVIAGLFQKSIIKPILWGCTIGISIILFAISPLLIFLNLEISMINFYISLAGIFVCFVLLCLMTTYWTIMASLRDMP